MTTQAAPMGWARAFFGPSRTRPEAILGATGAALVIALLITYVRHVGGWQDWSAVQIGVLAITGADLVGGIFTISAATASRWYHRPGLAARRFRIGFVITHAFFYLVPVAAVFDLGWAWVLVNAGLLVGAAAAIESAPAHLKRMVALCLTLAASLANLVWLPIAAALAWLPVLLFVKVLVCFLVPETRTAPPPLAVERDAKAAASGSRSA